MEKPSHKFRVTISVIRFNNWGEEVCRNDSQTYTVSKSGAKAISNVRYNFFRSNGCLPPDAEVFFKAEAV